MDILKPVARFLQYRHSGLVLLLAGLLLGVQCLDSVYAGKSGQMIRVSSQHQIYEPLSGKTRLVDAVNIAMRDLNIKGDRALIAMDDGKPKNVTVSNDVRMVRSAGSNQQVIQAESLKMDLPDDTFRAEGNVVTTMGGEENVEIHSASQVFDQKRNLMKAIGNVTVKKGAMFAKSPEAVILLGDSGSAEKIMFIQGAYMRNEKQEITAEKITINLKTGDVYAENNVKSRMLTQNAQGKQSEARVESHLQEIDSDTGTLLANGKAIVQYEDMVAKGPKAVFYMDKEQLDRIVLNGRAEVEDPGQRVVGDTITITLSPKQFKAQGNVQSFIKAKDKQKSPSSGGQAKPASPQPAVKPQQARAAEEELMLEEEVTGAVQ